MSRITNAILEDQANAIKGKAPMLDLSHGGQYGLNRNYKEWISNQAHVTSNVHALLISPPKFMKIIPDSSKWISILKQFVETRPTKIDGLNSKLTVETVKHGQVGAIQQSEIVKVSREEISITHDYTVSYGRPEQEFIKFWIETAMKDPETQKPNLVGIATESVSDLLADMYGATVLYFETDPTGQFIDKAWLVADWYPKDTGDIIGSKDIDGSGELLQISVPMAGFAQVGVGVNIFAQSLLDSVSKLKTASDSRPAFIDEIDTDVSAVERGYAEDIENFDEDAISD